MSIFFLLSVETGGKHVLVPSEVHAEAEKYAKVYEMMLLDQKFYNSKLQPLLKFNHCSYIHLSFFCRIHWKSQTTRMKRIYKAYVVSFEKAVYIYLSFCIQDQPSRIKIRKCSPRGCIQNDNQQLNQCLMWFFTNYVIK